MWAASLGVIYFSDSYASSDDTVRLPGWWRFDAAVFAKINETWRAQINVENIFDRGYWASADGNNNISPGQPRTIRLTCDGEVLRGNLSSVVPREGAGGKAQAHPAGAQANCDPRGAA